MAGIDFAAPYPADTRAKGYRFELDYERIVQSDTWALASAGQRPLLLMIWFVAWQQTPCGSLPNNDELIAARIGVEIGQFRQNRTILLRGWDRAGDGRLYHPVVTEMVLEMLDRKAREANRKAAYREKMKTINVPALSHGTTTGQTRESDGSDDTGTGTSSKPSSYEEGSHQAKPDDLPACPHTKIVELYAKHLPELPQPRIWNGQRANNLKARWRWLLTTRKPDGKRYASTMSEAVDFFDRFFGYVASSDFLTGRDSKWQGCDLGWLVKAENFAKVIEGKYHQNREAA
jgi:hypothetical protein